MRPFFESITSTRGRRLALIMAVVLSISVPAYVWCLFHAIEFTSYAAIGIFLPMGYGAWFLMDWAVKDIDTFEALQYRYVQKGDQYFQEKPNLAWAVVLAGYLVLVGLGIHAAAA